MGTLALWSVINRRMKAVQKRIDKYEAEYARKMSAAREEMKLLHLAIADIDSLTKLPLKTDPVDPVEALRQSKIIEEAEPDGKIPPYNWGPGGPPKAKKPTKPKAKPKKTKP